MIIYYKMAKHSTKVLHCRAKAKDRNFDFGRNLVIDIFGTFKTSFIMCISILSQFRCFSEKIMGCLNRNFEKPWRNQGRTPYNTSYCSFTLFGTLKWSYGVLPWFNCTSKWSYGYGLELYSDLHFFFTVHKSLPHLNDGVDKRIRLRSTKQLHITKHCKD